MGVQPREKGPQEVAEVLLFWVGAGEWFEERSDFISSGSSGSGTGMGWGGRGAGQGPGTRQLQAGGAAWNRKGQARSPTGSCRQPED